MIVEYICDDLMVDIMIMTQLFSPWMACTWLRSDAI